MHEFSFHYPWHNAPKPEASRPFSFDWNAAATRNAFRDANREAIRTLVVKPDVPPIFVPVRTGQSLLGALADTLHEMIPDPPPDPKPQEVKPHDDPAFRCDRCHCARRRADLRPAPELR